VPEDDDDREKRLGSSGVFKIIADAATKVKRALSEGDSEVKQIGTKVAQAFIAGRFADVYAMTTSGFQKQHERARFISQWSDAVRERGSLTGFQVTNAGSIDVEYIPGLEEVPQADFEAMVQITFSTPKVPLEDDKAFTVAVVLLDDNGATRIGAIHTS